MLNGETEAWTLLRPAQTSTDISFSVSPQSYQSPTRPLRAQQDHDLCPHLLDARAPPPPLVSYVSWVSLALVPLLERETDHSTDLSGVL